MGLEKVGLEKWGSKSGAGGARTRDQRIMRASHLGKWDLTMLHDMRRQTTVIQTGTKEYAAETCRGLKSVVETPAACVRTGDATAVQTAARGPIVPVFGSDGMHRLSCAEKPRTHGPEIARSGRGPEEAPATNFDL
ncbi:hypothetical protein MCNS_34490 [Mycobacterium conspicuum]|uniref:Uncharacterized protein n=1 Tax=Mycobacterium conspicuum TaxID=44010 RepID=A0A7I7YF66_9MYCO|nr:hypothetical protein MCNS_34490 [Mycobacterium conspicuum]